MAFFREGEKDVSKVCDTKSKLVEQAGTKFVKLVHRADSWESEKCAEPGCTACKLSLTKEQEKLLGMGLRGKCPERHITYINICSMPGPGEGEVLWGNHKSARERGGEHQ